MPNAFQLHDYGLGDWLLSFEQLDCARTLSQLHTSLAEYPNIRETIVGYDTLLIRAAREISQETLIQCIENALHAQSEITASPRHHDIEICYDGPDLDEVAALTNLSKDAIIQLHSSALYTVRFLGFSPGFAYLDGLPEKLHLPRRSNPRPKMSAGAVAIGASHAGIYSIPSPGGWNWLGNTDHPLFNKNGKDASSFTLHPGDTLHFHPIKT